MRLSDVVSAEDVRRVHITIFEDLGSAYLRSGPQGGLSRRDTLQRIRNVRDGRIRRNIEAIEGVAPGKLEPAWSHHMAVNAGTHLWPDANHRTAMITFDLALRRAFDLQLTLEPAQARRMVTESKALRDQEYLRRARYYTIEEMAEAEHPYRRLFARYEPSLVLGPA